MKRYDHDAREAKLTEATRSHFSTLTRAVLNGDPGATQRVVIALGEYLRDSNALAELARSTLQHSDAFLPVLTDLIWTEARVLAEVDAAAAVRTPVALAA